MYIPRVLVTLAFAWALWGLPVRSHAQQPSEPAAVPDAALAQDEGAGPPAGPSADTVPEGTAIPVERSAARLGTLDGQIRSYVMSTVNRGPATDWNQWAVGGQLGYQSPAFHGLSLGGRFYASLGVVGNSQVVDPVSDLPSRYESGLFDFTDRSRKELAVLGEAFVDLRRGGHHLWGGRHRLKTPMLNPQDGRMIPTLFQGAWYQNTGVEGLSIDVGYLSHVYARSGPGWGRVDEVLGIYPQGRNVDATPADYAGHLRSAGILAGGIGYEHPRFAVRAWNYALQNILDAAYADAFFTPQLGKVKLRLGAQYLGGYKLQDGGNPDPSRAYMQDEAYHVIGARAELRTQSDFLLAANYDRVTDHGRFVFPRELGVEPLFVFMKRERTEGSGDVHGGSLLVEQAWKPGGAVQRVSTALSYGVSLRTDPREAELNKNGFPSLYQVNWDSFIHFGQRAKGLGAELLVVYKGPLASTHDNPRFVVNKVDMLHVDFILSYDF